MSTPIPTPEEFAAANNLPLSGVRSLMRYLELAIEGATPEQLQLIRDNPDLFITEGARRWHAHGTQLLQSLLADTEESRAIRDALAADVWTTVRTEKGLPL